MFKSFFKTALIAGLMVAMVQGTYAQKTADELKAERQELQTELKAKKTVKRAEKLDKLVEQGMPAASNVSSVDALATSSAALLVTTKANNDFLSKFKRTVTDNGGGEVDVTTEKAKLNDYAQLAVALGVSIASVAAETQKVQAIKDEIKSLSPAQAMPATKSVKFATDALDVCAGELQLQLKLVNNLIETIKSSGNY
jgi:hypothetical protein